MRKREIYKSEALTGIISTPDTNPGSIIVALHGIGSNEQDLVEVAEEIAPSSLVISLRSPIQMGIDAYSFFHVDFTPNGTIHDWPSVKENFALLERELVSISKRFNIPMKNISVMGFSQGGIMTLGLLLQSPLEISHYLCFSGRTLPEFAEYALKNPMIAKGRKIFLAHGIQDNVLPIAQGRRSKEFLETIQADLIYKEFEGGHGISESIIYDAKKWLAS